MADRDPDLATLLDDVKTIKSILQNEDAPFPRMWVVGWTVATALTVAGLLQYFVPFYRSLDFDGVMLWLWVPGFCLVFPMALGFLHFEMRRIGKKFLGQNRVRHLLYARFVIPPAALVLVWTASRNPVFSLEGIVLVVLSVWATTVEQLVPKAFQPIPLGFLTLGLIELGLGLSGPEITLANTLMGSATVTFVGFLFWRLDHAGGR